MTATLLDLDTIVHVRWTRDTARAQYRSAIGTITRTTSRYWSVELLAGQRHPFGCRTLAQAKRSAVEEANRFGEKRRKAR